MDLFWIVFFQVTKCSLHWCVIEIKHNEIKWLKPESVLQIWRRLYDASIIRFEADRSRFTVSYVRLHVGYKRRYKHTYKLRIWTFPPVLLIFMNTTFLSIRVKNLVCVDFDQWNPFFKVLMEMDKKKKQVFRIPVSLASISPSSNLPGTANSLT